MKEYTVNQKVNKRSPAMTFFACLLLTLGIGVLLYPIVGNHIAQWHRRLSAEDFLQQVARISEEERQYYLDLARRYNEFIFNWQQGMPHEVISYESISNQMGNTMGVLDIPALNIEAMPFYHGTSYQVLARGLGHMELTSIPIGGANTRGVITGHSGLTNQLLFTEIKRLQKGDIFFVNILGERLAYEIESFYTVTPGEVDKVMIRPDWDMVTLVTCTPPGINTYRLLVNGFRIPYEEAIHREVITRNSWSYQTVVLGSLAIGALFLSIFGLRYRYLKKMMSSEEPHTAGKGAIKLRRFLKGIKIMFVSFLLGTILLLGTAVYGYFRMQDVVPLGPLTIGAQEAEINQRNQFRIFAANYEEAQIASVNIAEYSEAMVRTQETVNDWGIGKILLPDVGIDLPILAGLANVNLLTGGATFRMEQRLGQGNYVLLAHSIDGYSNVLFQPLVHSRVGQRIYATDFVNVYTYEIISNQVVDHHQIQFFDEVESGETPLITLMRCEGGIGTIYRRIVQGELLGVEPVGLHDLERFQLVREVSGTIVEESGSGEEVTLGEVQRHLLVLQDPISDFERLSTAFTARVVSDPVQVALPLFLLLLFPILFLSMLPAQKKREP